MLCEVARRTGGTSPQHFHFPSKHASGTFVAPKVCRWEAGSAVLARCCAVCAAAASSRHPPLKYRKPRRRHGRRHTAREIGPILLGALHFGVHWRIPQNKTPRSQRRKRSLSSLSFSWRAPACLFVVGVLRLFSCALLFRLVRSSFVFVFVSCLCGVFVCSCCCVACVCVCACVLLPRSCGALRVRFCLLVVLLRFALSLRVFAPTRANERAQQEQQQQTRARRNTRTHTHRTHREAGNQKRGDEERAACVRQCPRAPLTHCLGKLGSMPGRGGHHIPPPARPASTRNKRAHRNTNTPPTHKRTPHAVLVCCCCWWLPCLRVVARCSLCCVRFLFCRCWCVVVVGRVCLLAYASCCWRAFLPRTRTPAGRRDTHNTHNTQQRRTPAQQQTHTETHTQRTRRGHEARRTHAHAHAWRRRCGVSSHTHGDDTESERERERRHRTQTEGKEEERENDRREGQTTHT